LRDIVPLDLSDDRRTGSCEDSCVTRANEYLRRVPERGGTYCSVVDVYAMLRLGTPPIVGALLAEGKLTSAGAIARAGDGPSRAVDAFKSRASRLQGLGNVDGDKSIHVAINRE
jgi:hypothetical protein